MEGKEVTYDAFHCDEIHRPGQWLNTTFLNDGQNVNVRLYKTFRGAELRIEIFVFSWVKPFLLLLQEDEYNSIRYPNIGANCLILSWKRNLLRIIRSLCYLSYKYWVKISKKTYLQVQKKLKEVKQPSKEIMDRVDSDEISAIANVVAFLIYADEIYPKFFEKYWTNAYHVTPKLVNEIQLTIQKHEVDLSIKSDDLQAIKKLIVHFCRLKINLYGKYTTENDREDIKKYLIELKGVEKARIIAMLFKEAITHNQYKEILFSIMDPVDDWRVQVSVDDRYKDLVLVYKNNQKITTTVLEILAT